MEVPFAVPCKEGSLTALSGDSQAWAALAQKDIGSVLTCQYWGYCHGRFDVLEGCWCAEKLGGAWLLLVIIL